MFGVLLPSEQYKELHGLTLQFLVPSSKEMSQHLVWVTDPDHQVGTELLLEWEQRNALDTCMIPLGASWYSSPAKNNFRNIAQSTMARGPVTLQMRV